MPSVQLDFQRTHGNTIQLAGSIHDIVFQVLLCRFRYKISFRDAAEFFLVQGFEFTHETERDWETRFAPIFAQMLRAKCKDVLESLGM